MWFDLGKANGSATRVPSIMGRESVREERSPTLERVDGEWGVLITWNYLEEVNEELFLIVMGEII